MKNPLLFAIHNIFGQKIFHNEETKIAVCIYFATLFIKINSESFEDLAEKELHIFEHYIFMETETTDKIYNMLLDSEIENAVNVLQTLLKHDNKNCTKFADTQTH